MVESHEFVVETPGRGLTDITSRVQQRVPNVEVGLATVFIHHTSASLIITENADPDVQVDLGAFLSRLVPDGDPLFVHTCEGPDDCPAHIRSVLTHTSLQIPVKHGRCDLGTWQGVFLWEHRYAAFQRRITVTTVS